MKRTTSTAILLILSSMTLRAQPREATLSERPVNVDLTIYNQNLSLVREERIIRLAKELSRVALADIPSTLDATSVHFRSVTDPRGVGILEQNYQYDLVHQAKVLEKYLGTEIEFARLDPSTNKEFLVRGKLLATGYQLQPAYGAAHLSYHPSGGMIVEIDGKIEINPTGRLVLPQLPEGVILKPQLEWLVRSERGGDHRAEVSYLAGGLSWKADYVALLHPNGTAIDLTGWVTLTNHSGTTFRNAGLKLVAGDINVVKEAIEYDRKALRVQTSGDVAEPQFRQSDLFEYKLYTLQRRTDVRNNETKQITLVTGRSARAKKIFMYDGLSDSWRAWSRNYSYRSQGSFGQQSNTKVGVFVTFKNSEASGLGIPLPKGKVRVYQRDEDGKEQFIGEYQIDHTAKDEGVRLYLGNAFDIVGQRVQKDFRNLAGGRLVEETIEIKVRNHKKEEVEVQVYEHPWRWSQWEIVKSSHDWSKVDQSTLSFPLKITRDGEGVVTYTIRYSW
jgi:hypothetical protein